MEKDFIIYQEITKVANTIFSNIKCAPGKYAAADIAKWIDIEKVTEHVNGIDIVKDIKYVWKKDAPFGWDENYDPLQKHAVSVDTFSCSFNSWGVFSILKKTQTGWEIPTAYRANFIREKETAAAVVSFSVPAVAKDIVKVPVANIKDAPDRPVYHNVAVDTRRRCLVVTNGNILTAVAVPEMNVSQGAKDIYLVSPELLKAGKGILEIDMNGNAANGGACFPVATDLQFPRWEKVLPAVQDARAVEIGNKVFKELKKVVLAVSKSASKYIQIVNISGTAGNDYITVAAADIDFSKDNSRRVSLPQPLNFDFAFPVCTKLFASVPAAEKIYFASEYLPYFKRYTGVMIYTANNMFSLYLPTSTNNSDNKTNNEIFPLPVQDAPAVPVLKVCNFPDVQDEEKETAPAVDTEKYAVPADRMPAVADQETAPETPAVAVADSVPAVDEETPQTEKETAKTYNHNSVSYPWGRIDWIRAYHYMKIVATKFTYGRPYSDNAVSQAAERLENSGISLKGIYFVYPEYNNLLVATIKREMKKSICVSVDIEFSPATKKTYITDQDINAVADIVAVPVQDEEKETPAADKETAPAVAVPLKDKIIICSVPKREKETAPDVQDEETAVPVADHNTPAVFAKVDEYAVNDENGNAVIFGTYAPQIGTDEETPAADSIPVADSVPAAAEKEIETILNKQFETYLAAVPVQDAPAPDVAKDEETAVPVADKLETDAVAVSLQPVAAYLPQPCPFNIPAVSLPAVDEETPQDEETAPAAFNIVLCLPAVADSIPVAVQDEETAKDEETAVPVADITPFASVFACMPEIWETAAAADSIPVADYNTPAVDEETAPDVQDEETPAVISYNFARRLRRVWNVAAAVMFIMILSAVPVADKLGTYAPAVQDSQPWPFAVADSVSFAPETPAVAVADSMPVMMKKQPQTGRKRARRVSADRMPAVAVQDITAVAVADSIPAADSISVSFAAVAADSVPVADSVSVAVAVAADSLGVPQLSAPAVADSIPVADSLAVQDITAVAADSVPVADHKQPQTAKETAPDVQDEETPAVDEETPQDEETAPAVPADSVPVQDAPAPAVPAVPAAVSFAAPAVPAVAVFAYVIGCNLIH